MQVFQHAPQLVKKPTNQIAQARYPARQSGTRKSSFYQTEFAQNKAAFIEISAEMEHGGNGNGNDFRVGNFYSNIFLMSARLEKIIDKTVYCKSAVAHFKSSPLFCLVNKILGGDFCVFKYQINNWQLGLIKIKLSQSSLFIPFDLFFCFETIVSVCNFFDSFLKPAILPTLSTNKQKTLSADDPFYILFPFQ